jgi:hypothetical protein
VNEPDWARVHLAEVTMLAEEFDPSKETFSSVGSMSQSRDSAAAVLLPGGDVLVADGGHGGGPGCLATTEVYSYSGKPFRIGPEMSAPRCEPSSILLDDGRVLIVGGADGKGGFLATAEIYQP